MENEHKHIWERITGQFSSTKKSLWGLAQGAFYWFAISMGIFIVSNDVLRFSLSFATAGQIAIAIGIVLLIWAWWEHKHIKSND